MTSDANSPVTQKKSERAEGMSLDEGLDYRTIFNASSNGMAFTECDTGRILDVNAAWVRATGIEREKTLGRRALDLGLWANSAEREACLDALHKNGSIVDFETKLILRAKEVPHLLSAGFVERGGRKYILWEFRNISERKQVEDALRESEEKYKLLIDATNTGFVILDDRGRVLDANQEYVRMTGNRTLAEVLGRPVTDWTAPHDLERNAQAVQKCMETGSVRNLIIDYINAQGTLTPIEIHATVLPGAPAARIMTVCRDITERKRSDQALRESEERFQLAMRGANDGLWDWNLTTNEVYFSPRWKSMLGYTPDELEHTIDTWKRLVHPDDRDRVLSAVHALREGRADKFEVEFRMRHRDGSYRHILSRAFLSDAEESRYARLVGTHVDISERKDMEEQLRAGEEKYRRLVEAANSAILTWATDGTILFVNDYCERFFGFGKEELIGRNLVGTIVPETESTGRDLAGLMREIQENPDRFNDNENENITRDGRRVWVRWANKAITDVDGRLIAILSVGNDITERKKAEEKLVHMHGLMQYVISHAQTAIAVHDREMRYIYVSEQYLRQYQVKEKDVIGKHHYDVFPDLPQKWREVHQRVLAGAVEGKDEDPYVRENGSVDWTRWECRPWYQDDGSIGGLIVYTEVITERKRREIQLEKDRRLLELIAKTQLNFIREGSAADVFTRLLNDFLALMNSEYGFIGQVLHTKEGQPSLKTHAVTNIAWDDQSRKIYADHQATGFEFVNLHTLVGEVMRTGKAVIANDPAHDSRKGSLPEEHPPLKAFLGIPLILDDRMLGMAGIANRPGGYDEDVVSYLQPFTTVCANIIEAFRLESERALAEERIRQNEQFIRNILDTVDEGFLVIDPDYRILTANKTFCSQAGLPCGEVIGRHCYEISHKASRPCYEEGEKCAVQEVFATGEPRTSFHRHRDENGHELYVETKAYPVKDSAGNITSVIETITNITEKHLLEEERLKTQKLESIGTLAGGIAHDFNNLLQGVFGYISLAKNDYDQRERSLAMLEQAEKALHQSVHLTSQLLTFSKGGKPIKKVLDLRPILENAARFALSGSQSDLRLDVAPNLRQVDADAGQIGQVIQNIVLNADQAMPMGGRVVITARNMAGADPDLSQILARRDHVVISVQDSGIGIPEQYLSRIFDPYFTTKEKGSGLGLATSYSIIRNHEGFIQARSTPGTGTVFTLYLPAAVGTEKPMQPPAPAGTTRTGRVLIMDDEEMVLMVAGEMIRALGHETAFAEEGETAVRLYEQARFAGRPFDVVILDLTIRGGMGGAETVKRLLAVDPGVRAIMSSGYSENAIISDHRLHGFKAFLKKPYDMNELRTTLNALLG